MRASASVKGAELRGSYLQEPLLTFGDGGLHVNPRSGIARFGPASYLPPADHPDQVRVGIIGSAGTIAAAERWLNTIAQGVAGDENNPEFPGYGPDRGFFSDLRFDSRWNQTITRTEISDLSAIRRQRERFLAAEALIDDKLRLLAERDHPPEYVVIALPDEVIQRCRVADYRDGERGLVHRDLRRSIKAAAMKYRIPTQLLRQSTVDGRDPTPLAKIAWNLFTGLYFKAGGTPWAPRGLSPATCYVGIGFYRGLGDASPHMHASLVQAFDEHGQGLVLRGPNFEWDPARESSRSPHLGEAHAGELIDLVLRRYREEMKQMPRRLVVHKSSRYWAAERSGFEAALRGKVDSFDLVALERQSSVRLITASKYPPLRGTRFSVGEIDFLYTTGFIASLGEFHGMHVPSPLRVADHLGMDTPRDRLLWEILLLTKMNWNSANFGGSYPITLKFSDLVGEVMREIPPDRDPLPQFKFYI